MAEAAEARQAGGGAAGVGADDGAGVALPADSISAALAPGGSMADLGNMADLLEQCLSSCADAQA